MRQDSTGPDRPRWARIGQERPALLAGGAREPTEAPTTPKPDPAVVPRRPQSPQNRARMNQDGPKSLAGGAPTAHRGTKDAQARPRGRPQEAKGPPQEAPRTLQDASAHPPRTFGTAMISLSDSAILTRPHVKNLWFFIHFKASERPDARISRTIGFYIT